MSLRHLADDAVVRDGRADRWRKILRPGNGQVNESRGGLPAARARVRFQAPHHVWLAVGGEYGSGLPADTGNVNPSFLLAQYGEPILDRVNLTRGRVRPNFSLDGAAGVEVYRKEQRSASFLIQADNLNNRINVINFASLFSGTAVGKPRSISALLRLTF